MLSLRDVQIFVPLSGGQAPKKPEQARETECLEKNNLDKPYQMIQLCAALIETKTAGDKLEAKMMLESRQLLQARSYRVRIAIASRRVWITSIVIFDTEGGPILIGKKPFMTTRAPSLRAVKRK